MTRIALLTIGTEISQGQVLNTNASWLANELVDLQFDVAWHFSVPDERSQMLDALTLAAERADIVITTGGLGPTSDDFTREVVAAFAGKDLQFDAPSWERIEQRLNHLGLRIAPSNKQQCYFPAGAQIIPNSEGTASAFICQSQDQKPIIVLPGPPREIRAVWNSFFSNWFQNIANQHGLQTSELHKWECIGISEAELAERVEAAVKDLPVLMGYRPHIPYVEIKAWISSNGAKKNQIMENIEAVVKPYCVGRGDFDAAAAFLKTATNLGSFQVLDFCTHGFIAERLGALLRLHNHKNHCSVQTFYHDLKTPTIPNSEPCFICKPGSKTASVVIQKFMNADVAFEKEISFYRKLTPDSTERARRYFAEQFFLAFL